MRGTPNRGQASADGGEGVATAIVDLLVPDGPPTERPLREALTSFLDGKGIVRPIRAEIAASWRRAASSGLQPDRFDPPYDPDVAQDSRLERAAAPVMDQLSADLAGTETGLLLTDHRGHVVDRRVSDPGLRERLDHIQLAPGFFYSEESAGTNGIGSALAQREPAFIRGGEHFADALTDMACAGAPITDTRNGQVLGVIDVSCSVRRGNPLMLPFAKRAAYEIEQRLLEGTSAIERFLYQRFLHARRRAKGPLALVGKYTMLANTAATRVLEAADQALLWEWAVLVIQRGGPQSGDLPLASGAAVTAECEAVHDGAAMVGAIIRLDVGRSSASGAEARDVSFSERKTFGWTSLTESERSVADLVAEGLTNREAGSRLFLSRHTVDAHLRHIYRKLGIRSRTELARVVAQHGESAATATA
jgi:DNA-binding CsgD family transcriptional regulator